MYAYVKSINTNLKIKVNNLQWLPKFLPTSTLIDDDDALPQLDVKVKHSN